MKIVEYRGARGLVYAPVTVDDADNFTCGAVKSFAGLAEVSKTTESSQDAHYYDNGPAVIITASGADTVTFSVSAIPHEVLADISGQVYDEDRAMYVEVERKTKYFAVGYITENTDGDEIYVWRLKGSFSIPDETSATKDAGTDANGQQIVFTGLRTVHKFTNAEDQGAKSVYVNATKNTSVAETTFFATVQDPDTVTKPTP